MVEELKSTGGGSEGQLNECDLLLEELTHLVKNLTKELTHRSRNR